MRGKTIVFIDNSNIFHGARQAGWRIDYKRLHSFLAREGPVWQTYFFASTDDALAFQQSGFYKFIRYEMRYEVFLFKLGVRTLTCATCGTQRAVPVEKGLDIALATRLLTLAASRAFDTAILVAADRDYLETVRAVKHMGMRVEIVAWWDTISPEMDAESSRSVVYLDQIRSEIERLGKIVRRTGVTVD